MRIFHERVLAYKRYHLSLAIRSHVGALVEMTTRDMQRRTEHREHSDDVAKRLKKEGPSVEPPPLPPRPAQIPHASRLPRMVTNDEGEVFWYIPKKPPADDKGSTTPPAEGPTAVGRPIGPVFGVQLRSPKADEPLPDTTPRDRGNNSSRGLTPGARTDSPPVHASQSVLPTPKVGEDTRCYEV